MQNLLVSLFLCFSIMGFSQQGEYSYITLDPTLKKNANSIVRYELTEVDVTDNTRVTVYKKRVVTVLNEKGDRSVDAYLFYDDDTKVKTVEAIVYDTLGQVDEKFKRNDFNDASAADGFSLYSDDRVLVLNYVPKSYPYTIEFTTEVENRTSAFLPRWYPLKGYVSSTEKSEYKILFDPTNAPNYKAENVEGYEINITEAPASITCTATNVMAVKYEEHAPEFDQIAPRVLFALNNFVLKGVPGNGESWESFGHWMRQQLLADVNDLPVATVDAMKSLVAGKTTNIEKARAIYQYLQDKVRYVSVQVGIGGWKPIYASQVDNLSYGDCKALTNYTKALLDAVDVPSYYTILHAGTNDADVTEDFVAMQGNHVILGVPDNDEIVWLECTSQEIPFGHLGTKNDNRNVLIITEDGGQIIKTKRFTAEENAQLNTAEIFLNENGSLKATFQRISKGQQYDSKYRLPTQTTTEIDRFYKNKWGYNNGLSVENVLFDNDRETVAFKENLDVEIPGYTTKMGADILYTLNTFNRWDYIPPRMTNRKRKLEIDLGFQDLDTYKINLPSNIEAESLPEAVTIDSKFGNYKMSCVLVDDTTLEYKRQLTLLKGIYTPEDYKEYRDFLKTVVRLDKTKILLKRLN